MLNHKKMIFILVLLFAGFLGLPGTFGVDKPLMKLAPINPAFESYQSIKQNENQQGQRRSYRKSINVNQELGLIPDPIIAERHDPELDATDLFPSELVYDLRDPDLDGEYNDSLVTPVRDQASCGACWAFATYGTLETYLKSNGSVPDQENDFSEQHLIYNHGFDNNSCSGGNLKMSAAYLLRNSGPVRESHDTYDPISGSSACPDCSSNRYVDSILFLPVRLDPQDIGYIKYAIYRYGGVYASLYYDDQYYHSDDHTYYYDDPDDSFNDSNHAVTIVGWDDTIDIFQAPGKGAFIIKNSFGPEWGDQGYFYVSYYDESLGFTKLGCIIDYNDQNFSFETIYQYDTLGWTGGIGTGDGHDWAANVFTAAEDMSLTGVGFYATSSNTNYNIQIYRNFNDMGGYGQPGDPLLDEPLTGSVEYSGYYIIHINDTTHIKQGEKFVVVIGLKSQGSAYPIAIETPIDNYASQSISNPGESYVSDFGYIFFDIHHFSENANVCIKAYANAIVDVPPMALSQEIDLDEDAAVDIVLTGYDQFNRVLNYMIIKNPDNGILTGSVPFIRYTPDPDFNGTDFIRFRVNNGSTISEPASITLRVFPINDPPSAFNLSIQENEDTEILLPVIGRDPDNDPIDIIINQAPQNGQLVGEVAALKYIPDQNFFGVDHVSFMLTDHQLNSDMAQLTITIMPVNDPPVAQSLAITTIEDANKFITLSATDVENDPLQFRVVTPPAHGQLLGTLPYAIYAPNSDYSGTDQFSYEVSDGIDSSEIKDVLIVVFPMNDIPSANDQTVATIENQSIPITVTASDSDADSLTFVMNTSPSNGILTGTLPNVTYLPNNGFSGTDTFQFHVTDGEKDSNIATVSIQVAPVNQLPTAFSQTLKMNANTSLVITLTGQDNDGDSLTYHMLSNPTNGEVSGDLPIIRYTPLNGFSGIDRLTFRIFDGNGYSNSASVLIMVMAVNYPPVAESISTYTYQNKSRHIELKGSDPENKPISYRIITQPSHGTIQGTIPLITYTPEPDYTGMDEITYRVNDGSKDSNLATVTIHIRPLSLNNRPVAESKTVDIYEDSSISIRLTASDSDQEPLSYSIVSGPAHGTLMGHLPNVIYYPTTHYYGIDRFTFTASDGILVSTPATVTIRIQSVNDAPIITNQTMIINQKESKSLTLQSSDPDGDALFYKIISLPAHGEISGSLPNITYSAPDDYTGTVYLKYIASDGRLDSQIGEIKIMITDFKVIKDKPLFDYTTMNNKSPAIASTGTVSLVSQEGASYSLTSGSVTGFHWMPSMVMRTRLQVK